MRATTVTLAAALALVLLAPTASAWAFELGAPIDERLSVRSSLLLAGALQVNATGAAFGASRVDDANFGFGLVIDYCPDQAGSPTTSACAIATAPAPPAADTPDASSAARGQSNRTTDATLRILGGGFIAIPAADAEVHLDATSAAAALGGANVTYNRLRVGPTLHAGGAITLDVLSDTYAIRPLGANSSLQVLGAERDYTVEGTGYTLVLQGADRAVIRADGAFVALGLGDTLDLAPALLSDIERHLDVDLLHESLRAILPADQTDRRAHIATAFGPFQIVPALLNGVVAQSDNLTIAGENRAGFTLLRVTDMQLRREDGAWNATGNATYAVHGDSFATTLGEPSGAPILVPSILLLGAIGARAWTRRDTPPRATRNRRALYRLALLAALVPIAAWTIARLLGVHPLLDLGDLSTRSRAQLLLLTLATAATAWLAVGLPLASLLVSGFRRFRHTQSVLLPALLALLASGITLWLATDAIVAVVAKFVRL